MNMKKTQWCVASALLACVVSTASHATEYDCTAVETASYISQVTYNVMAPSTVTKPIEHKKAYIKSKEASGDGDCVTIFTDGSLTNGWKELVDTVRNASSAFPAMPDSPDLTALLEAAKIMVKEKVTQAMEDIGGDICAFMTSENLSGLVLDEVNKKYGIKSKSLEIGSFADAITAKALKDADPDVRLLISHKAIESEMDKRSTAEIRKARKDLWKKF
jgi:hypothetical protein